MSSNNNIESTIQKGFWSDISGTIEHTETLIYLLCHAKLKQRNLAVTLIDLKNAFGVMFTINFYEKLCHFIIYLLINYFEKLEEDNQLLINGFIKWCTWADLLVRRDKCLVFGIKKIGTKPCENCPYLIINCERIPSVKRDDSFTYIRKDFNFGMDCTKIKDNIIDDSV